MGVPGEGCARSPGSQGAELRLASSLPQHSNDLLLLRSRASVASVTSGSPARAMAATTASRPILVPSAPAGDQRRCMGVGVYGCGCMCVGVWVWVGAWVGVGMNVCIYVCVCLCKCSKRRGAPLRTVAACASALTDAHLYVQTNAITHVCAHIAHVLSCPPHHTCTPEKHTNMRTWKASATYAHASAPRSPCPLQFQPQHHCRTEPGPMGHGLHRTPLLLRLQPLPTRAACAAARAPPPAAGAACTVRQPRVSAGAACGLVASRCGRGGGAQLLLARRCVRVQGAGVGFGVEDALVVVALGYFSRAGVCGWRVQG